MVDISALTSGAGIQLEANSYEKFGSAVEDFSTGSRTDADGNNTNTDDPYSQSPGTWQSPRYAADVVAFQPKHRFMFKVNFVFATEYNAEPVDFSYVVKSIDKPKVTFDYEDVNLYNFRTQVLKSIKHEPLNMQFHDDIKNSVINFFNDYRKAYSPISSMTHDQTGSFENSGMNFENPNNSTRRGYSAARGILRGNAMHMLKSIKLTQVFAHGSQKTEFIFLNPRIITFDFDNVDHEAGSDGSAVSVQFSYDSMYIENSAMTTTPSPKWGITDMFGNGAAGSTHEAIGQVPLGMKPFSDPVLGVGNQFLTGSIGEQMNRTGLNKIPKLNRLVTGTASSVYTTNANATLGAVANGVSQGSAGTAQTQTAVVDSYTGESKA